MYRSNLNELLSLYEKLNDIKKEMSKAIALLEQSLNVKDSEYNPDEYLKKWVVENKNNGGNKNGDC